MAGDGKELILVEIGMEEDDANPQKGGGVVAGVWLLF